MTFHPIRSAACAAALFALAIARTFAAEPASAPNAAPARTYAIVSLIGDQFAVVSRGPEVGTRLDPNQRKLFPVPDAVFDRIASGAVERAILNAHPGAPVLKASIRDPRLFALQEKLFTESAESHDMRIALHDLLTKAGATDLVLVTKRRGDATFPIVSGRIGAGGPINGIGFYLDNESQMHNTQHLMAGTGFLAPYAFLMVSMIDLADMHVVKSKQGLESTMFLPVDKQGADRAWDALSAKEKVDSLDLVIRRSVETGMADVLAP